MVPLKKWLLLFLCCIGMLSSPAQRATVTTSTKKSRTITSVDWQQTLLKYLPILVFIGGFAGIAYQIRARRRDDRLKNQLDRLNKQITEFYGPLYSYYETGHRNYYNFLILHGDDVTFRNPHFDIWSKHVFQPTNNGMEHIIINKADLILGRNIPECFLDFCKWAALMKIYNQAQQQKDFDNEKWKPILDNTPHPQIKMQAYLRASFEVLKEEQSNLLSGKKRKRPFKATRSPLSIELSKLLSESSSSRLLEEVTGIVSERVNALVVHQKETLLSKNIRVLLPKRLRKRLANEISLEISKKLEALVREEVAALLAQENRLLLYDGKHKLLLQKIKTLISEEVCHLLRDDVINGVLPDPVSPLLSDEKCKQLSRKIKKLLSEEIVHHLPKEKAVLQAREIKKLRDNNRMKAFLATKNKLFAGNNYVNEAVLIAEINQRTEAYINESKKVNTWENKTWVKMDLLNKQKEQPQQQQPNQPKEKKLPKYVPFLGVASALAGILFWNEAVSKR